MKKSIAFSLIFLFVLSALAVAQDSPQNGQDDPSGKMMKKAADATKTPAATGKGNKMRDRVMERVRAYKQGKQASNSPEECRALDDTQAAPCMQRYTQVASCWDIQEIGERGKCLREKLGITSVDDDVKACKKLTGDQRATCAKELKDKVHSAIALRIYHLQLRAQKLIKRGVPEGLIVNVIADLEEAIKEFRLANSKDKQRDAIQDARDAWKQFIQDSRTYLTPAPQEPQPTGAGDTQ